MKIRKSCIAVALSICVLFQLSACAQPESHPVSGNSYTHVSCISSIQQEDCRLCGNKTGYDTDLYWGQDNLGLVNVNTFDIFPLSINRYDNSGNPESKAVGVFQSAGAYLGDSLVHTFISPDHGWSDTDIITTGTPIDPESIAQYLCQTCLYKFSSHYLAHDTPSEIAVVNFTTRELRPLENSCTMFFLGNYLVDCTFQENGAIDLLVVYRPIRYPITAETNDSNYHL